MYQPEVIIAISGYTKVQKSGLARMCKYFAGFDIIEMSTPIREHFKNSGEYLTVAKLIDRIIKLRNSEGKDILARYVKNYIDNNKLSRVIIVGLRSYYDHLFFKNAFSTYKLVFVHSTTIERHERLKRDPTSIAKTQEEFNYLDRVSSEQGIKYIAEDANHILINDKGFPITALEQLKSILFKIANELNIEVEWLDHKLVLTNLSKQLILSNMEKGYEINKLPTYKDKIPPNGEVISRVMKERGELTNVSTMHIRHVAYVTFPLDGPPRANHYHCEKMEYIYIAKGKVILYIRRGGRPEEQMEKVIIEEGSILYIKPGWAHAFVTVEEGYGIEFSPTAYEIISRDKVKDILVAE
ncbi:MAG: hypothetical protein JSS82_10810 [Bacteroidetes bacterium]|nr:hypothetical protein [Bacteroidota bacterium]